jgi:hypothetical protein
MTFVAQAGLMAFPTMSVISESEEPEPYTNDAALSFEDCSPV